MGNQDLLHHSIGDIHASARLMRAVGISILFHAIIVLCVAAMNQSIVRTERPLIVDLNLSGSASTATDMAPFARTPATKPLAPVKQILSSKSSGSREPEIAPEQPMAMPAVEVTRALPQATTVQGKSDAPGQSASAQGTESSGSRSSREVVPGEKPAGLGSSSLRSAEQSRYLKEHFAYIKDLVQGQVYYPMIARNMRWEGRVVVSFIITHDGTAKEVKVRESRGIEVLDGSAVEAVKKASPFPRPPTEAQILLPIDFRLH